MHICICNALLYQEQNTYLNCIIQVCPRTGHKTSNEGLLFIAKLQSKEKVPHHMIVHSSSFPLHPRNLDNFLCSRDFGL